MINIARTGRSLIVALLFCGASFGLASDIDAQPAVPNGGGNGIVIVPSANSNQALSHASVSSLGTSLVAKASAGNLYGYNCTAITGAAAGYCIAYNATSAPSTGALTGSLVLDACSFNGSPAGCSLSRIPMGVNYSAGIVILLTTAVTPFTYTTGTDTAFISADYQ
jgi:hypothetical protein